MSQGAMADRVKANEWSTLQNAANPPHLAICLAMGGGKVTLTINQKLLGHI